MNLTVDAQALDLRFLATSEGILPVKTEYGTDKQKVDSAGRPLFSGAALQCVRLTNDGRPNGVDSSVSVSVRRAAELQFGQMYELAGSVTVIHYVANGRMGVSIQCDDVVPVATGAPKLNMPKGE